MYMYIYIYTHTYIYIYIYTYTYINSYTRAAMLLSLGQFVLLLLAAPETVHISAAARQDDPSLLSDTDQS